VDGLTPGTTHLDDGEFPDGSTGPGKAGAGAGRAAAAGGTASGRGRGVPLIRRSSAASLRAIARWPASVTAPSPAH
jgi:hypothetical protein